MERSGADKLRVAVDTSFAGVNPTGVGIYSRRVGEYLAREAGALGLEVRCVGPACGEWSKGRLLGGLYQEWPTYTQAAVPLMLARFRPDVIHSTSHLGPLFGPHRLVVTVHDLIFRRYPDDYNPFWLATTRAMLPAVLRHARAVVVDSEATRADLEAFYGVRRGKMVVVYPGVDEAYRVPLERQVVEAARAKHGLAGAAYVLCLGPWVRRKNLEVVVEAFGRLAQRLPELRLAITGKPSAGMQSSAVEQVIAALPVEARERVRLLGHLPHEELRAVMQGAGALAYPSLFEGFGLPPLEAMAAGVPVVESDAPAVVEVTGGAALIARAGETGEWTDALFRILTDYTQSARLRERGLTRSSEFTWDRCVRKLARVYERVAG